MRIGVLALRCGVCYNLLMVQGRHSEYTPELGDKICRMIAEGESLITVCKTINYPYNTIARWLRNYKEFDQDYARARETQADNLADQIVQLADDETLTPESRRVRVDARKWIASKLKPKKYGDRTILAGDAENPLQLLAARLDKAIEASQVDDQKLIDVTPTRIEIPIEDDGSDLC